MKKRPLRRATKWWRTTSFMVAVCHTEICADTILGWDAIIPGSFDWYNIHFRQFFYKHPLLAKYRWYWRIECVNSIFFPIFFFIFYLFFPPLDLMFIFTAIFYMIRSYLWKKIRKFIVCFFYYYLPAPSSLKSFIAFTITMYEYLATIPTLWNHVMGSFCFFQKLNKLLTSFFFFGFYYRFCSWPSRIHRWRQFTRIHVIG